LKAERYPRRGRPPHSITSSAWPRFLDHGAACRQNFRLEQRAKPSIMPPTVSGLDRYDPVLSQEAEMRRREFLAAMGGAVTWPTFAPAQQTSARPIIGLLSPLSAATAAGSIDAFHAGLRDLGYEDGRNITLEYRFADGAIARLPELAAQLLALKPAW
jgi:hypothetical protein